MQRRTALIQLAALVSAACGGGGGGGELPIATNIAAPAPAPAPAAPAAPPPAAPANPNIAIWGDSLTPPVVVNLRQLAPTRTVFDGGVIAETSSQILRRQLADTVHTGWINVFWYGHNNQTESAQIRADIAASVAHLDAGNTHFVVMSVVNQATVREIRGGADYAGIVQLNESLAATYPQNYLDIRAHLVQQANRNLAQDMVDLGNDVVPQSLRFDHIHLNNEGSIVVARRLLAFIEAKGW